MEVPLPWKLCSLWRAVCLLWWSPDVFEITLDMSVSNGLHNVIWGWLCVIALNAQSPFSKKILS